MGFRVFFMLVLLSSCQSFQMVTQPEINSGMQQAYVGFVPARIAVLNCQAWPFAKLPDEHKVPLAQICKDMDAFVIKHFTNQPYMHGYSPSLVNKLIKASQDPELLTQLPAIWQKTEAANILPMENVARSYEKRLLLSDDWKLLLSKISQTVRHADALLMPFVFAMEESCAPDRGLMTSARSLHVGLFLIDMNQGQMIWWEDQKTSLSHRKWLYDNQSSCPAYGDWNLLKERVFRSLLWKDFPGKM